MGGRYRFGMQPPQGDVIYLGGTFTEIARPSRIVYTWAWEADESFPDHDAVRQHDRGWRADSTDSNPCSGGTRVAEPELEYQAYIRTTPDRLWEAITSPEQTKQYFYGLAVVSDWKPGSSLKHVMPDGRSTTIEGSVLEVEPRKKLVHTFATTGVSGAPTRVTWEIEPMGSVTPGRVRIEDAARDGQAARDPDAGPGDHRLTALTRRNVCARHG